MRSGIRFNRISNRVFLLDEWEYTELNVLLSTIKIYSMKKNEIEKREQLSKELEMSFDETLELFSEETLGTMMMTEVMGGVATTGFHIINCNVNRIFCRNTNCPCTTLNQDKCDCGTKQNCNNY